MIHSYLEARGGMFPRTVVFGNRYYMERYMAGQQVDLPSIDQAEKHAYHHFGNGDMFNRAGWLHILEKHKGRLPLRICAPPEGTVVPTGNVLMTIENTDEAVPWLTNYVETMLMREWYPYTVASLSYYCRDIILKYLIETGTPEDIWFKLHDFGGRGGSSTETIEIGGAAHLVNFKGTDTLEAIDFLFRWYDANFENYPAFSVAASEHSTMTTWGQKRERDAYANMLEKYPTGIVSVVSDSWDIFNAVDKIWGQELKDKVLNRNGRVVIRPDSGEVIPTLIAIFRSLEARYGMETNAKGYKVLPPQIRVLQGDGITSLTIEPILQALKAEGWSADNIVFGMGGGLLQKVDRDTMSMALKCSRALIGDEEIDVYKAARGKGSKRGRLALIANGDSFSTVRINEAEIPGNVLSPIFLDGDSTSKPTIYDIRKRSTPALLRAAA
jgi:nicotinamide phosphoribosyltransferase